MAGAAFGLVDRAVERQLTSGDDAEPIEQILESAIAVARVSSAVTVIAPELIIGL
jgi:hypothetical protein